MTALRASTARLLLDRVAEGERAQVVRQVARSLGPTSGAADVGFAATLLRLHADREAKADLLAHLKSLVEHGDHAQVAAICQDHVELNDDVFATVVGLISSTATRLNSAGRRWIAVPMVKGYGATNGAEESEDEVSIAVEDTRNALQFASRMLSSSPHGHAKTESLLEACIILLGAGDKRLSTEAQEVLYSLLGSPSSSQIINGDELWARVQSLIAAIDGFYKTVGFSLWLRWSVSAIPPKSAILEQDGYWSLLVEGLGKGDGERRKAALQILRASVQLALRDSSLYQKIAAGSASDQSKSLNPRRLVRSVAYQVKVLHPIGILTSSSK